MVYISILNNISIDCDCDGNAGPPIMKDLGILGSYDPISIDKASFDLIHQAPDSGPLLDRIKEKHGLHTLEYGSELGLGNLNYELIKV
jgi:uncharacterized Fe-S center protein